MTLIYYVIRLVRKCPIDPITWFLGQSK